MRFRFRHDPESGALYVRFREGKIAETLEMGPGAYLDIDHDGNVVGAEFLSLEEFGEFVDARGGTFDPPDHIEDPGTFHLNPA